MGMESFVAGVTGVAMRHQKQRSNAEVYVRGLLAAGARKSLEPLVERLEGDGDYQSLQQFLADSPWSSERLMQAVVEHVAAVVGAEAWVLDDTGFPKDGKKSPGVKRQYSGTLGKIGNCQIGVSLHAVSEHATLPLGWALYLPQEWCDDPERRRRAKIPEDVVFQTKPQLGGALVRQAAGWAIDRVPVLGDAAYGENTQLRSELDSSGMQYVLSINPETTIFTPGAVFNVPDRKVFIDGRAQTVYPARFYAEEQIAERGAPGWDQVLDRRGASLVLWPSSAAHGEHYAPMLQHLATSPQWVRVYDDGHSAVFAHVERASDWIERFRRSELVYPDVAGAQLFLANTYVNANQFARARAQIQATLSRFPETHDSIAKAEAAYLEAARSQNSAAAWFGLGFLRDAEGDGAGASTAFREALSRGLADPTAIAYAREALEQPER